MKRIPLNESVFREAQAQSPTKQPGAQCAVREPQIPRTLRMLGLECRYPNGFERSLSPEPYMIRDPSEGYEASPILGLAQLYFDASREHFKTSKKHIEITRPRGRIETLLHEMIQRNRTRMDYMAEFQRLIDEYNNGAKGADVIFEQLLLFTQKLTEEEQRGIRENLSEAQLGIFDVITKPRVELTKEEIEQVKKKVARNVMDTLTADHLELDWRKKEQTRAGVQETIQEILDRLPSNFTKSIYKEKCKLVYQHVYDSYPNKDKHVYSMAGQNFAE